MSLQIGFKILSEHSLDVALHYLNKNYCIDAVKTNLEFLY